MFLRPGTVRIPFASRGKARERARAMQRVELDPARDPHARAALEAYADACAADMPWLAEWLRDTLGAPQAELTRCAPTLARVFDLAQAWAAEQPDYARTAWEHVRGQLHAALARQVQDEAGDDAGRGDGRQDGGRRAAAQTDAEPESGPDAGPKSRDPQDAGSPSGGDKALRLSPGSI
ncbi:hypothetical protein F3J10_20520 [Burkholderia sp. Cy-637]|nr:hypothetical protein [Burkholderia sp. Cy-637]